MKNKTSALFSAILIAAGLSSCASDVRSIAGGVFPRPGGGYGFDLRREGFADPGRGSSSSFADLARDRSIFLSPDVRLAGTPPTPRPATSPRIDTRLLLSPDFHLFGTPPARRSTLSDRLRVDPGLVNPDALRGAAPVRRPSLADRLRIDPGAVNPDALRGATPLRTPTPDRFRIDTSHINPDVLLGAPVWHP